MKSTQDRNYTARLITKGNTWWKRVLDVQAPYRWNLKRLNPGFVLDIGCGTGRHLTNLGGNGVGIDHNPHSVEYARQRGLQAFTPDEFQKSEFNRPARFDSLLLSHVAEHMRMEDLTSLLRSYAELIRPGGQMILICPQEAGFKSDPTHVEYMDLPCLSSAARAIGFELMKAYSFPLPRAFGKVFIHNEWVVVARR